ncbi:MAG: SLBB domain-containing protein [Myxococcales bacterium]|nr:SLBB domain-containing protein [Myxococcales bacterium]
MPDGAPPRTYHHRGDEAGRRRDADQARVLPLFDAHGGLRPGAVRAIQAETGVPAATVHGVGSFYHLIARPDVEARVCEGLSCRMRGADRVLAGLRAEGRAVEGCACLGQCDRAPAVLWAGAEAGHGFEIGTGAEPGSVAAPHLTPSSPDLAIDLAAPDDPTWPALEAARHLGPAGVRVELRAARLRGRGGAGFPAHLKWDAVAAAPPGPRVVVCNADEGEPGTFKDREVLVRRPHRLLEGLAIAAHAVGADRIVIYLRGEFEGPRRALEAAVAQARGAGHLDGLSVEIALGHGAYICGEETALLEALEGRRGMPRHKPPFPTEAGLFGRPTLINNVESLACVPAIVQRGGAWFAGLGRGEASGTKLFSVSGDVARPGVYELPLGVTFGEVLEAAGGVAGGRALGAFSPGGASSGLLPPDAVDVVMDFGPLAERGSMLGSAGVVVLDETRDLLDAALTQARFFRAESCGQCAPCRIGTQVLVRLLERARDGEATAADRDTLERVAWEMDAGSICGLGMAAPLPALHLVRYFPDALRTRGPAEGG